MNVLIKFTQFFNYILCIINNKLYKYCYMANDTFSFIFVVFLREHINCYCNKKNHQINVGCYKIECIQKLFSFLFNILRSHLFNSIILYSFKKITHVSIVSTSCLANVRNLVRFTDLKNL